MIELQAEDRGSNPSKSLEINCKNRKKNYGKKKRGKVEKWNDVEMEKIKR